MDLIYRYARWHETAGPLEDWLARWFDAGWRIAWYGAADGVLVTASGVDYLGFPFIRDRSTEDEIVPCVGETMVACRPVSVLDG